MAARLPAILMFLIPLGLAPIVALAATCGDYPLTAEQISYLDTQSLDIDVPQGEVPVIVRCDVDGNGVINNDDLFAIREHRGQPAAHPDDPMDWDGDGVIHGRDVGGCASSCSANGCAVREPDEEDGLQTAVALGETALEGDAAACYQADDFDGDGADDFAGVFEYIGGETRGGDWLLEVVILNEDANGNVQHVTFPYTGKQSATTGEIQQHLSLQPAGVVDLNPGSITIDAPGIVSYRDGEPKVIYYYVDGELTRSFYGIDD